MCEVPQGAAVRAGRLDRSGTEASKETRHAGHVNHRTSKEVVAVAQRTGRGIALEEVSGIRDRVRPFRGQRATPSSWPFRRLEERIRYRARRAGVPVIAHYTSHMCPRCGHTARNNHTNRDTFFCRRCGLAGPADHVAGVNVRNRARSAWVLINGPVPQGTQHLPKSVDATRDRSAVGGSRERDTA